MDAQIVTPSRIDIPQQDPSTSFAFDLCVADIRDFFRSTGW